MLIDFYTEWCPPCKAMAPVLEQICETRRGSLKVVKIDAEQSLELADRHRVSAVPTFVLYRRGEILSTTRGFIAHNQFNQWIEQSLA